MTTLLTLASAGQIRADPKGTYHRRLVAMACSVRRISSVVEASSALLEEGPKHA